MNGVDQRRPSLQAHSTKNTWAQMDSGHLWIWGICCGDKALLRVGSSKPARSGWRLARQKDAAPQEWQEWRVPELIRTQRSCFQCFL